jgi:hypothetical protein
MTIDRRLARLEQRAPAPVPPAPIIRRVFYVSCAGCRAPVAVSEAIGPMYASPTPLPAVCACGRDNTRAAPAPPTNAPR